MQPGRSLWVSRGERRGRPAPNRACDGEAGGARRIAEAATGAGAERAQRRLQAQKQQQPTMITKDTMNAAPAILKA